MKILVADVGNSYIKMEAFEGERTLGMWQFETNRDITEEKIYEEIERNFSDFGISKSNLRGIVICSVVPELTVNIQNWLTKILKSKYILNVTSQTKTGLIIPEENKRMGADRIADMVAAAKIYGAPAVVVGMGTATVFTVIDTDMRILGGQIVAGGDLALKALLNRSTNISKIMTASSDVLTKIKIIPTNIVIGRNTEENMLAGSFWGLAAQVEGIASIIKRELINRGMSPNKIKVIATGGMSNIFKDFKFSNVDYIDTDLTRKGLRIIGENNFL